MISIAENPSFSETRPKELIAVDVILYELQSTISHAQDVAVKDVPAAVKTAFNKIFKFRAAAD